MNRRKYTLQPLVRLSLLSESTDTDMTPYHHLLQLCLESIDADFIYLDIHWPSGNTYQISSGNDIHLAIAKHYLSTHLEGSANEMEYCLSTVANSAARMLYLKKVFFGQDTCTAHLLLLTKKPLCAVAHAKIKKFTGIINVLLNTFDYQHYRSLGNALEHVKDGLIITNTEGKITWCNSAILVMSGYSFDELKKRTFVDAFSGLMTDSATIKKVDSALTRCHHIDLDMLHYHKKGNSYWTHLSSTPFVNTFGEEAGSIIICRDISQLRKKMDRLQQLASQDPLTGIHNRSYFFEHCAELIKTSPSIRRALLIMDLDNFKQINDHWGHACGDDLLIQVASNISDVMRSGDLFARLGGDEFIACLEIHNPHDIAEIIQRIGSAINKPLEYQGNSIDINVSIGCAYFPEHGEEMQSVFYKADLVMYSAKKSRKLYSIFSEKLHTEVKV